VHEAVQKTDEISSTG